MSYILDALRKAEAERERGSVPGLNAQPAFAGARPGGSPPKSRLWILVLALGTALAIAIAVALYLLLGRSATNDVPSPVAKSPMPASPVPVPVPTVAAPPVATPPIAPPVQTVARPQAPVVRKPRPAAPVAAPASAAAPAPAASKAEERIYAVSELPDDIRRQLPQLSVGGSMYSPKPANRLVIINGQVLREGEHISPELAVQQIRQKAAVLAFKGYRYALPF
ncbi:MAG: general secretion pathway protein GspB [Burkholderiales bacterium]